MNEKAEPPDHHIYNWVNLFPDTLRFFLAAARYYQNRLEGELQRIQSDDLFSEVLDERTIESLEITKEAKRFSTIADRIQAQIDKSPDAPDYELTLRHQDVRVLKALGILYLSHLEERRDGLSTSGRFSTMAIQALDSRIARFREILSLGVFKDATPWPLLVEEAGSIGPTEDVQGNKETTAQARRPPPRILSTIEILDPQLRERCLDLLEAFDEGEQSHRFDTVVAEATRVLEHRIRQLTGADASISGVNLMTYAFGGDHPKLVVSEDSSEQEAAHLMYRGATGFIRNPFHHRLIEDVSRERVLQILGLVDYLIYVAQTATPAGRQDA
jgi:uncharacterized protein (TIGR02391 family)